MKYIIKLAVLALLISISYSSAAQTFGIKAGYGLTDMVIEENETAIPYDTYNRTIENNYGFHAGAAAEFPIYKIVSIETGLLFSTMGYKSSYVESFGETPLEVSEKYDLYYLNLPLAAKATFPLGKISLYGSAGAYGGMGLSGNKNTEAVFGELTESDKESISWGTEQGDDDFKKFDYGLTFGAGVKISSVQVGFVYNWGLANISPGSEAGASASNRMMGVSVGYMFGKSKKDDATTSGKSTAPVEEKAGKSKKSEEEAKIEAERIEQEKIKADSIAAALAAEEKIRKEKARADSIQAALILAEQLEVEKIKQEKITADSIAAAQNVVIYRVQFASNTTKKGSYEMAISGKNYPTWEYFYSGSYRSTVGDFKTFGEAAQFQKLVRQSGHPQAFVVAFKNNVRVTDPALFR